MDGFRIYTHVRVGLPSKKKSPPGRQNNAAADGEEVRTGKSLTEKFSSIPAAETHPS